jgi:hypothetical protein
MKIIITVVCFVIAQAAWAEPGETGVEAHTDLSLTVSSLPEAQAAVSQSFIFPFLRGEGPLTGGNNINLTLGANVSPVSFNLMTGAVWTPAAFFNLSLGARAGSGWNYPLFGSQMKGMGLYRYTNGKKTPEGVEGAGMDGIVWNVHAGTALQFDLAAVLPGDWNHAVMRVYNEINYKNYTGAQDGEPWYYENDDGISQNSFSYYFSALLGYQMPLFIDLAGVMFELSEPLHNPDTGESLTNRGPSLTVSLAADFKLFKRFNLMVLGQWTNGLIHPVTDDYPRQWGFYRVAAVAAYHLK